MAGPDRSAGLLTAPQVREVVGMATECVFFPCVGAWRIDGDPVGLTIRAVAPPLPGDAGRTQRIACGALLLNLRVAIRSLGMAAVPALLPDPDRSDVLGVVESRDLIPATASDLVLARAQSRSAGGSPQPGSIDGNSLAQHALGHAARTEGAWLAALDPGRLRPGDLTPATSSGRLVVVVGTLDDGPLAQLQAGQGAQRVVLTAIGLGLLPTVLTALPGSPANRRRLRRLLGGALWPQVVLALGPARP